VPHRRWCYPKTKRYEFAVDPAMAPRGVPSSQPDHQLPEQCSGTPTTPEELRELIAG